jgi:hypothetical protein
MAITNNVEWTNNNDNDSFHFFRCGLVSGCPYVYPPIIK